MFNLLKRILAPKPIREDSDEHIQPMLAVSLYSAKCSKKALEDLLVHTTIYETSKIKEKVLYLEKQIQLLESDVPVAEKIKFYEDSLNSQL